MACLPATWLTVQIAFDTDRGSDHYRIGSGAGEERAIPDGPRSGALAWRGSGGLLADPVQLQKTTRCGLGIRGKRAEFLFFCPQQNGEGLTIQGQQNGDRAEAGRLSRRVILGQKTTLGATDLLCHPYQRKPCA